MKNKVIYIAFAAAAVAYNLFPVDVIPDVIPIIGAIDDVFVALVPLIMGFKSISSK